MHSSPIIDRHFQRTSRPVVITLLFSCIGVISLIMPHRVQASPTGVVALGGLIAISQNPPEVESPPPDLPPAIESGSVSNLPEPVTEPAAPETLSPSISGVSMETLPSPAPASASSQDDLVAIPASSSDEPQSVSPIHDPEPSKSTARNAAEVEEPSLRDENVIRTQNEAPPLGGGSPSSSGSEPTTGPSDMAQYRPGVQGVGIYVEVISPPSANLQQETTFRIIVKNAMRTTAHGVVVRDFLPDTLEYIKSQPEGKKEGASLVWDLGEMPIGSDKTITLVAKPVRVGSLEHTATVSCQTGTRSRLIVQEPKIKVEQTLLPAKPLKGQPVQLRIAVSNPGTGVARNVAVVVKVSQGLQDGQGSRVFDQEIRRLGPGERMELQPLTLNTVGGGNQSSEASATSADVATAQPEAKSSQAIEVLEPKLKLTMAGPSQKYTNTEDIYELTLENPGTAPARGLVASVFVPDYKGVLRGSNGADLENASRRLFWKLDRLDPGEKRVLKFEYRVGAMGTYPFTADVRAEGGLAEKQSVTTIVTGVADVDFQITEKARIIDVGDTTDYVINIRNHGTKDAENVLISAELSDNLKAIETDGHEGNVKFDPSDPKQATFPPIDHLPAGQEMTLVIRVQALKPGLSRLRVFLHHEDLGTEKLEKQVVTPRVTDKTQITSKGTQPQG